MAGVMDERAGDMGATATGEGDRLAREILRAVRGLRYGSVEITIHDGQVVQIERREKVRLERKGSGRKEGTALPAGDP
jgi:hypothetical protein